jgi:hypothetical protein
MLPQAIKINLKKSAFFRKIARRYNSSYHHVNWSRILAGEDRLCPPAGYDGEPNQKVLIPTSVGSWVGCVHVESMLAVALTLRNTQVELMLCDGVLPACLACEYGYLGKLNAKNKTRLSRSFCRTCFSPAYRVYQQLGMKTHRFSDWITPREISGCHETCHALPFGEIRDFTVNGLAIGEQAHAAALRFFARGSLDDEPEAESVLRQYLAAALISARVFGRLLEKKDFSSVVFNHGIYVPQGIIGDICRQKNMPVVNWNPAYRRNCFIFSHRDSYHHTMISEPVGKWENMAWDAPREHQLMTYLESRRKGSGDWIWFHQNPLDRVRDPLERLGIDFSCPCIGLLTSVMWDAALHYRDNAFPDMLGWVFETIDYFSTRSGLQLIIRVHPGEIQGGLPSRQKVCDEIRLRYDRLPPNVTIVGPESSLSTYAIMEQCDAGIIYNTKTGIELAAMGIPVIVAGEAWIRNKGFSTDVSDPDEYRQVLDSLPKAQRMNAADTLRARKYAYHFFFRRMIPLEFMHPARGNPPYRLRLNRLASLKPGQSRGLDLICDGILKGTDFIFDDPQRRV